MFPDTPLIYTVGIHVQKTVSFHTACSEHQILLLSAAEHVAKFLRRARCRNQHHGDMKRIRYVHRARSRDHFRHYHFVSPWRPAPCPQSSLHEYLENDTGAWKEREGTQSVEGTRVLTRRPCPPPSPTSDPPYLWAPLSLTHSTSQSCSLVAFFFILFFVFLLVIILILHFVFVWHGCGCNRCSLHNRIRIIPHVGLTPRSIDKLLLGVQVEGQKSAGKLCQVGVLYLFLHFNIWHRVHQTAAASGTLTLQTISVQFEYRKVLL